MKVSRRSNYVLLAGASALAMTAAAPHAFAQDDDDTNSTVRTMNTVVVTTQKTEESLQDVPIAVSAFDSEMLENLNINTGQELQFNIPNFQSSTGNFTAGSIGVRGIANAAVAASSDASVGMHINGIPTSTTPVLETEFYDMERVEVLRGPQGTLYGRNATGGVVNVVTAKPILEEFAARTDLTLGEFNTTKFNGFVNIPMGERVAARVAGFYLKRDGFSDANLPDGSSTDVDDRDLYGIRGTLAAEFTDKFSGFLLYDYFSEDSTRVRSAKQLCTRDTRPFPFNQGCVPYQLEGGASLDYARDSNGNPIGISPGFDSANNGGTFPTIVAAAFAGLYPVGLDPNGGLPVSRDLREYDTSVLPRFEAERDLIAGELVYEFENDLTLTFNGSYTERFRDSFDNYNKTTTAVGFNIVPGLAPDIDGDGDGDYIGIGNPALGPLAQTANIDTGLAAPSDRIIVNDFSTVDEETTSFELRLQSDYDGPFNFNVGAIKIDSDVTTNYYVISNGVEAAVTGGNAAAGAIVLPVDRSYFLSRSPVTLDALGIFGEGYWDVTDDFKITLGLRYTDDDKQQLVTPTLVLSLEGLPEEQGVYERSAPQQAQFEEITGRFGFDWQTSILPWSDDSLLYAFYSRGYKGGGINPPQAAGLGSVDDSFDPEFINAYEIGTKSTILNGAGFLNLTAFYYDYEGYQISNIINRTALNVNVDAEVTGFEAEFFAQLTDSFAVNASLGLLDTELGDVVTLDTYDQTGGDPNWVVVKNINTAQNCIANVADVNNLLTANGGALAATAAFICDPATLTATITGALIGAGLDADTAAATAAALTPEVREGNPVDISGNSLPRAPDTTLSIGAQYQFPIGDWGATVRGDYYYQSEMFTRIFNLEADRIDSWENFNASITFDNEDLGFSVELYGKNLFEDDQITGQYLSDASTALFTNVFVLDPRQFGVKFSKTW